MKRIFWLSVSLMLVAGVLVAACVPLASAPMFAPNVLDQLAAPPEIS